MQAYDVLTTTVRRGLTVDEIEFALPDQQPSTGYLVRQYPGVVRRAVLALHDERTDKAALLPELMALGALGFVAMSVDCPASRDAMRQRDALGATRTMHAAGQRALALLGDEPDVGPHRMAIVGHGLGGEIAGSLAEATSGVRTVVAVSPLLHRGRFVRDADHPLAAGARLHLGDTAVDAQADGLIAFDLGEHMHETRERHWLVQLADDDDRYTAEDRREFSFGVPASARVSDYPTRVSLHAPAGLHERVSFLDAMT